MSINLIITGLLTQFSPMRYCKSNWPISPEDIIKMKGAEMRHNLNELLIIRGLSRKNNRYDSLCKILNKLRLSKEDEKQITGVFFLREQDRASDKYSMILIVKKCEPFMRKFQLIGNEFGRSVYFSINDQHLTVMCGNNRSEKLLLFDKRKLRNSVKPQQIDSSLRNGRQWSMINALKVLAKKIPSHHEDIYSIICTQKRIFIATCDEEPITLLRRYMLKRYGTDYGLDSSFSSALLLLQ
jgi:hypothetical protein